MGAKAVVLSLTIFDVLDLERRYAAERIIAALAHIDVVVRIERDYQLIRFQDC